MTERWIPEPTVILLGCRPWSALADLRSSCPVCGEGIRPENPTYYCAVCDSLAPSREAQVRTARLGMQSRDRAEAITRGIRSTLRKKAGVTLSESSRRRIWNGYGKSLLSEAAEVTNLAKLGRDWLTEIGQVPDWTISIDSRGKATRP